MFHLWRSTDCLSLTLNYYHNGLDFFSPEIHNLISDGGTSGKTAGEFTGWYFAMAALWQVFGVSEGLYRTMVAVLFVTSLLITQRRLASLVGPMASLFVVLWLFAQPALVYYGFGFLSNVPAFSFALLGASSYLSYAIGLQKGEAKPSRLLWAIAFFALGGLLKVTALLLFFTLLTLILMEAIGFPMLRGKWIFPRPWFQLALLSLVLLPNVAWYYWAAEYNALHGGKYTFNGIWPYWEASAEVKVATWEGFLTLISRQIMAPINWWLMLIGVTATGVLGLTKRVSPIVAWAPLILFGGSLLYSILWFQAWKDHDYYFINLYALPALTWVAVAAGLRELHLKNRAVWGLRIAAGLLLLFSIAYTEQHLELRYRPNYDQRYFLTTEEEEGALKYIHWVTHENEYGLLGIRDELDAIGISRDEVVISIPDPSFCITLYLMDQRGFTNMGEINRSPESILKHIGLGARYLVIKEAEYEADYPWVEQFMTHLLLQHNNIRVYDLHPFLEGSEKAQ